MTKDPEAIAMELEQISAEFQRNIDHQLAQQPQDDPQSELAIKLNNDEFYQLIASSVANHPTKEKLWGATDGITTKINADNTIEIEGTIKLNHIPYEVFSPTQQKLLRSQLEPLSLVGGNNLNVKLEGELRANKGELFLKPNAKLQVGWINVNLNQVTGKLGVKGPQLRELLSVELDPLRVTMVETHPDQITIVGRDRRKQSG
ncbi:MAG: hypothetical protein HC796_04530 [Synechococcaceae cyanobacterium RL_1_2]|nr:hypothetical protein [Synechococcaceae cyanobacterium RL_1_2]